MNFTTEETKNKPQMNTDKHRFFGPFRIFRYFSSRNRIH